MTQQEILDYNRRCAEFLKVPNLEDVKGDLWDFLKTNQKIYSIRTKELTYHSDWNWIMEVVESIENLPEHYTTAIHSDALDKGDEYKMFIFNNEGDLLVGEYRKTKKEAVVNTINQFLILYKENKL